jgi:hypothetical protein
MLTEKTAHRHRPTPSPEIVQLQSTEPPAPNPPPAMQPAPSYAIRQPRLDERPIRLDRLVAQGKGHKSWWQATQAVVGVHKMHIFTANIHTFHSRYRR